MAHCDLATGKIYGCKKGTFAWWHEKGHLEYNKTVLSGNLAIFQQLAFYVWMFSTTLMIFNRFMAFVSLPALFIYVGADVYEELWCNKYANRNLYK